MRGWNATDAPYHRDRLRTPLARENGKLTPTTAEKALTAIKQAMAGVRAKAGSSILFCLGPAVTNEDAYAVKRLARELNAKVCPTDLAGLPNARRAIRKVFGRDHLPNGLTHVADADVAWIFGADLRAYPQVASRLFAAAQRGAKIVQFDLFGAPVHGASLEAVAVPPDMFGLIPGLLQKAAFDSDRIPASAKTAPSFAPFVESWRPGKASSLPEHAWLDDARLKRIVAEFLDAKSPAVVIGARWLSSVGAGEATIQLLQALVLLGAQERILFAAGESNSWGAWDVVAPDQGDADALLDLLDHSAGAKKPDAMFVVGEDLMRRTAHPTLLAKKLAQADLVVVMDCFRSETAVSAHFVLPTVTFAEQDGTATSMFGVVQRMRKAVEPIGESAPARDWIARIGRSLNVEGWPSSPADWFAALRKGPRAYQAQTLARLFGEAECPGIGLEEATTLAFSPPKRRALAEAPKDLAWRCCIGSHPALWSTGAISEREEIMRREVNQSVLRLSPVDLTALGLRDGSPVKVIAAHGNAAMSAQEDKRLPAGVVLAVPLPGSAAASLRGFFRDTDCQSLATQPVPVRLEKI